MPHDSAAANRRVLIVDDDLEFANHLSVGLRGLGYHTALATTSNAMAAAAAAEFRPAIMICDIACFVGGETSEPGVPIPTHIGMARRSDMETAIRAMRQGAVDFFDKDSALIEVAAILDHCFDKRERRDPDQNGIEMLWRAKEAAEEASRTKSEFLATVSHELRTPLNAIIGFSEIISHGFFGQPGHPKYIEYARDISLAGRELHGKIGDILEFANVEAGRHPIALTPVDVAGVAATCVDEMAGRAFSRRIELGVVQMTDAPASADTRAVKRALSNLLCNALNFTPDGGKVRVEIVEDENAVIARVRDSGRGFSEDEAERAGEAFATFERVGSITGLGLGLAIATTLAERMGGEMVLVRNQSLGTTAELRLKKA